MAYIEMVHSFKRYHMGDITITANNDVSFGIERGELAIILGSSGAGKSTVLNILGGMDTNSEGKVIIDGVDISDFNAKQLTDYRRNNIGFVFQFYNLVANLTAKENVELASELVKNAADPVQTLVDVGLGGRGPAGHGASATGLGQRVGVLFLLAKLDQGLHVLDALVGGCQTLELRLHRGQLAGHFLCVFRIVPQSGFGRFHFKVLGLGGQSIDVEGLGNGLVFGARFADRLGVIKFCHRLHHTFLLRS